MLNQRVDLATKPFALSETFILRKLKDRSRVDVILNTNSKAKDVMVKLLI
jgi:hypothetical protein